MRNDRRKSSFHGGGQFRRHGDDARHGMPGTADAGTGHVPVKLAIVGGGAAGMFAAAAAAELRIPCGVIERKVRLGSKVPMTANGRCIVT